MIRGPAYRIVAPDIVLRCFAPSDAPEFREAVAASRAHLGRWMTLPEEGAPLEVFVAHLRALRARFDTDRDLHYGAFLRETSELVGAASLELDTAPHARRLGGWVRPELLQRSIGFQGAAALTRVAFEVMEVGRLEVRCAPDNLVVAHAAEKLGFKRDGVVRGLEWIGGAPRDQEVWTMLPDEYPGSPAAAVPAQAFDALERRLL